MKLISFGCSFIYGSDLKDCNPNYSKNIYASPNKQLEHNASTSTWPALIAKQLKLDYECRAEGGSSNIKILDQIIDSGYRDPDAIFLINWSWIDRYTYIDSNTDTWKNVLPSSQDKESKLYYKYFHSTFMDKFNTLVYIKTAIDTMQNLKIPFVMTYTDQLMLDAESHTNPSMVHLQNYIKPYLTTFNNMSFLDYSRHHNFPISSSLHPLEEAHKAAADYLLPSVISRIQNKDAH